MRLLLKGYKYVQILSLDVVFGACAFSKLIAESLSVELRPEVFACLALATWCVYTLDHLVDSIKLKEQAITERHSFHFRYRYVLTLLVIAAGLVGLFLSFRLTENVILGGVIAGCISLFHLIIVRFFGNRISLFYQKEASVSVVFALGVFTGPVSVYTSGVSFYVIILFLLFLIIIFWNVTLFSWYDYDVDASQDHSSITRLLGFRKMKHLFVSLFFLGLSLLLFNLFYFQLLSGVVFLCWMVVLLFYLAMSFFYSWFKKSDRYRLLGDAMLYFPAILWFVP